MNRSSIFIILLLARLFMKFERKIAALLGTYLLSAQEAGTKMLIGCKWVMGTVDLMTILQTIDCATALI